MKRCKHCLEILEDRGIPVPVIWADRTHRHTDADRWMRDVPGCRYLLPPEDTYESHE